MKLGYFHDTVVLPIFKGNKEGSGSEWVEE